MEKLPLVQFTRALDRVVDCGKNGTQPAVDDLAIAAQWIEKQRISNLARGLFEGCDECWVRSGVRHLLSVAVFLQAVPQS